MTKPFQLEMMLYKGGADTVLETVNLDSRACLNFQFVRMLSGVEGTHSEFRKPVYWEVLQPHVDVLHLFF